MFSFIFTVRINSKLFAWVVCHVQERYVPKFSAVSDVRYCVNQYAVWATWKKNRPELETENK